MQITGVTLLLTTAVLGFAQQDNGTGTHKIRTCTGLELQIVLPVVNAPFRVYFAYNSADAREYLQPVRNFDLPNQGAPDMRPPVVVFPEVVCDLTKILFDSAVHDEQSGRLDRAKLTLLTLASTNSDSPLAAKAKEEVGAIYIFEEAQAQARSGQSRAAYDAFNVVALIYPESALARLASSEMGNLDPEGKWKR
jgi:hypothetical protein